MNKRELSIAMLALTFAVACGEDSETANNATGTTSTGTAGAAGQGGNGGSSQGGEGGEGGAGGNQGPGGGGQGGTGGNPVCISCNDYFDAPSSAAVTDVCGVLTYDPVTWTFTCTAGSSCELLDALLQCACVDNCPDADECGDDLCVGIDPPNNDCGQCLNQQCDVARDACVAD